MGWRKLGRVFVADGERSWMSTHAAIPRALHLHRHVYRVFFAVRDSANRSHVAWGDLDLRNPTKFFRLSAEPTLAPGGIGFFDDNGVLPSWLIDLGGRTALFYIGVSLGSNVPFSSFPGLAILDESKTSGLRHSATPVLERTPGDPLAVGGVSVVFDNERGRYHMWYGSTRAWATSRGSLEEQPVIKYAFSENGLDWVREDVVCLEPAGKIDYFGTPCVLRDEKIFKMWFSFKTEGKYRIGYAESLDGIEWTIDPEGSGLTVSNSGWDSDEVAYPHVFRHGDNLFMLYNGNHYGKTGFGIAICDEGPQ